MWDQFDCHGNSQAIDSHRFCYIEIISDSKENEFVWLFRNGLVLSLPLAIRSKFQKFVKKVTYGEMPNLCMICLPNHPEE